MIVDKEPIYKISYDNLAKRTEGTEDKERGRSKGNEKRKGLAPQK